MDKIACVLIYTAEPLYPLAVRSPFIRLSTYDHHYFCSIIHHVSLQIWWFLNEKPSYYIVQCEPKAINQSSQPSLHSKSNISIRNYMSLITDYVREILPLKMQYPVLWIHFLCYLGTVSQQEFSNYGKWNEDYFLLCSNSGWVIGLGTM